MEKKQFKGILTAPNVSTLLIQLQTPHSSMVPSICNALRILTYPFSSELGLSLIINVGSCVRVSVYSAGGYSWLNKEIKQLSEKSCRPAGKHQRTEIFWHEEGFHYEPITAFLGEQPWSLGSRLHLSLVLFPLVGDYDYCLHCGSIRGLSMGATPHSGRHFACTPNAVLGCKARDNS